VPGVFRPQNLSDVLNVIQQTAVGNTDTSVSGVGYFAEVDETLSISDSVSVTTGTNPAWGAGTWGCVTWS
jgi:hypothetical protein